MEEKLDLILEKLNRIEKQLGNMEELTFNDLMNTEQACAYLSISLSWLYKLTSTNEIPFMKRGKKLYFSKKDISSWLTQYRNIPEDEIEKMARDYITAHPLKSPWWHK